MEAHERNSSGKVIIDVGEYDQRTLFGCIPGACASGNNGARDNFDLLWAWLAARLRGLAR
jgi:hypothetical protein